ncbi:MAG TPA: hypothetical protein VEW46_16505 [Pyrinomonadaceae bacterium]|nr:hypothetical protein [Pyrinomonadaceae bacterium]
MLKKFTAIAFTSVVMLGIPAQSAKPTPQDVQNGAAIQLQNGQLYLNGKLIHKGFSVMQTRFSYLYFYVPSHGLFTISSREFDGATQSGTFEGPALSFNVNDLNLELKSSSQILAGETSPAWIKFDPDFKLDVKSVMLGYGDKEKAPYEWPDQLRKNRK